MVIHYNGYHYNMLRDTVLGIKCYDLRTTLNEVRMENHKYIQSSFGIELVRWINTW